MPNPAARGAEPVSSPGEVFAPQPPFEDKDEEMLKRTLTALAAAAVTAGAVAIAFPAHAAPARDSVTISLEGLNPGDPADAARIDRRLRNAARDLCETQLIQPLRLREQAAACEKSVIADGRASVELAAARQGGPFRLTLRTN
jgi:UrcA family protein